MISPLLATILLASAALGVTLNPTSGQPNESIEVTGTDFAASTPVGIGFGEEIVTSDENMAYAGTGVGPYYGKASHWPIKPGSFVLTVDTTMSGGIISTYTDDGDGTLSGSFEGAYGDINYTTGEWSRTSTADLTGLEQVYSANYTCYEFNVTDAAGVVTGSLGSFTTSITIPAVVNGTHTVTAIDEAGNIATSDFTVVGSDVIPEASTLVVISLLSSVTVIIATLGFRKRENNKTSRE